MEPYSKKTNSFRKKTRISIKRTEKERAKMLAKNRRILREVN